MKDIIFERHGVIFNLKIRYNVPILWIERCSPRQVVVSTDVDESLAELFEDLAKEIRNVLKKK